jgi:hypothetical protein
LSNLAVLDCQIPQFFIAEYRFKNRQVIVNIIGNEGIDITRNIYGLNKYKILFFWAGVNSKFGALLERCGSGANWFALMKASCAHC